MVVAMIYNLLLIGFLIAMCCTTITTFNGMMLFDMTVNILEFLLMLFLSLGLFFITALMSADVEIIFVSLIILIVNVMYIVVAINQYDG